MSTYDTIQYATPELHVALLTLNRPDRLNAYTDELTWETQDAIRRFQTDDDARVLIVTGAGRGFCSGGDIGASSDSTARARVKGRQLGHARQMIEGMQAVVLALARLDKPSIAMVNGPAVAGGLALALGCDFRIAGSEARLGDTSGKIGLLPDEGGAWLFPQAMGLDRALKMTLLHEVYDAETAFRLGLVTEVVPQAALKDHTMAFARALAERAPLAVRLAKQMMRRASDLTLEQSMIDAALSVMITNDSEDVQEGKAAFFDKRKPEFQGR